MGRVLPAFFLSIRNTCAWLKFVVFSVRFRVSSNRKKSGPAPFREPSLRHLSRTLNYLPSLKRRTVFF